MQQQEDPLNVTCPECSAAPGIACVTRVPGQHRHHRLRGIASSGHPALRVECSLCSSVISELCQHLGRKAKVYNVGFHTTRDIDAYEANTDTEPGLSYQNGDPVKRPWIEAHRTRKKDGLRSVHFRRPGVAIPMLWASTHNGRTWHAAGTKMDSQRAACGKLSAVDALADIVGNHTIWAKSR